MKYTVTQSFLAFGKCGEPGQTVELTEEQADVLVQMQSVAPYETKVMPPPENKAVKKKPLASLPVVPAQPRKTRKNSKKSATKR